MPKKIFNPQKSDPAHPEHWRMLNRDGSFNVVREGMHKSFFRDGYHSLLAMSWWVFMLLMVSLFYVTNLIFAVAYVLCGEAALQGSATDTLWHRLIDSFFFSIQTFSTIGYGKITPNGIPANLLVSLEAFIAIIALAFLTGLVFSRFSKPTALVIFSKEAVINFHEGVESLMFRMANERLNQIVDANVTVTLSISEKTREGEIYRTFYDMPLERSRSPIFALTWTIVHPIDEKSPLYGKTREDLIDAEAELIVSLVGLDETFAQTIHTRFSYTPYEVLWNHTFLDIVRREHDRRKGNRVLVDISKIHHTREISTKEMSV